MRKVKDNIDKQDTIKNIGGYVSISGINKGSFLKEEFIGQTADEPMMFPKGLGAKHPFEFDDVEKLTRKYGVINELLSKLAGEIVTDFEVKFDNENAQALIDGFFSDTNAHIVFDAWVKEALGKGNGFIELDLANSKMRVMNANHMYV